MNAQPKKAANLTISTELLEAAKGYKINLSQTLETALAAELKKCREAEWLEQNREAIEAYNQHIEKRGLFSDRFRTFAIERK
ncbi:MAG: type II toxin-antitoxin system CcdA family antitoxin [Rhodocyclales bacterium]|nr:type II toxin-antitoxin system CcdA family antitoxin [Rhodocyclales bacterium]